MPDLKITVITVCFNAEKSLEETIKSIISQDYKNLEYIIIDGSSMDKTIEIVKKYSCEETRNKFDHKISRWVSEPDSGIYDAMNKGLKMATGNYIIFMGADDVFANAHVLSNVAKHLVKWDGDVVYGSVQMKTSGRIDHKPFNSFKIAVGNICHQCIFYPRAVYSKFLYETKYRIFADYAYNLALWKNYKFRHIPVTVSIFNDQGISGRLDDMEFYQDRKSLLLSSVGWWNYMAGSIYRVLRTMKSKIKIREDK